MTAVRAVKDGERSPATGTSGGATRALGEHAREIRRDAAALAQDVRGTTSDLGNMLREELRERPIRTLGAAAGLGYLLGGGLHSRLTVSLLGSATRLTTALMILRELYEMGQRLNLSTASKPSSNRNS